VPHSILIMPTARRQIAAAVIWWTSNRPAAPALLIEELDRALVHLAENPNAGVLWPRRANVRRLVLGRVDFLVFYRVRPRAQRVEILALWHARRGQPPPL
jgi:plasmid stabilization system protein ParE